MTPASLRSNAYPKVYRHLMCVGLLGVVYRLGEDAAIVNQAVEGTLDDPRGFHFVQAVALGMAGRPDVSRDLLANGPAQEPVDDPAKLGLAVALLLGGDRGWRYWVEQVLAVSPDAPVRETAWGVLDWVRGMRRLH